MGQHSIKPDKMPTKIHKGAKRVEMFCIHFIVEGLAGLGAILIYEVYLRDSGNSHDIATYVMYLPF